MYRETFNDTLAPRRSATSKPLDMSCLADLIGVLEANPRGLRRWSVMRAMRTRAEKANREVTPKFEDDVERVFRRFCEGDATRGASAKAAEDLFFRPKETAGEVWAVHSDRAQAWLANPAGI